MLPEVEQVQKVCDTVWWKQLKYRQGKVQMIPKKTYVSRKYFRNCILHYINLFIQNFQVLYNQRVIYFLINGYAVPALSVANWKNSSYYIEIWREIIFEQIVHFFVLA